MSTELTLDDLSNVPLDLSLPSYDGSWEDLCERRREPVPAPVYRMPERDKMTGPKAEIADGEMIQFSRVVVRVGYEFGIHSISRQEWFETGLAILVRVTGLPVETVKRVICALNIESPFKGIKHEIYNEIVRPLIDKTPVETRNVRAMWFYDYAKPQRGTIIKRVKKLTGKREEGYYGQGYDEPGDWEPPYLGWTHAQILYEVDRGHINNGPNGPIRVFVYPADAVVPAR